MNEEDDYVKIVKEIIEDNEMDTHQNIDKKKKDQ